MRRHIDDQLDQWKASVRRKPLVLFGARQVGKTYALRQFARRAFDSIAYVDFSRDVNAAALFDGSIAPADVIAGLELLLGMNIDPDRTLVVFDEVQLCERALTSLKYFSDDAPQYHVVAAGSLLGVKVNRTKYSFPVGKVDMLTLHPMDFEEYLWARGDDRLADAIGRAYDTPDRAFPFHDMAMGIVREYLAVGGMPEAVAAFMDGRTASVASALEDCRNVQRAIATAYVADMAKYASAGETQRIVEAWDSIPRQFAKENHKFQYKEIRSGARANAYQGAVAWLVSAGIVTRLTQVGEPVALLRAFENPDNFKLYMADTGLLGSECGVLPADLLPADGKSAAFRGAINENYVLQQLVSRGVHAHYWGTVSKAEVEFVARSRSGEVVPIEVKSGRHVTARSLTAYRRKYQPPYAVRVSARNFGIENGIRSVPLYAAWMLGRDLD